MSSQLLKRRSSWSRLPGGPQALSDHIVHAIRRKSSFFQAKQYSYLGDQERVGEIHYLTDPRLRSNEVHLKTG
ncbi:hypothetical protein P5673_013891 [Acropora cervicornis]|uniref:Uncharacterized protein n=1 Tax=Acropora cervicornis TaxID=6130 RepID=A0AAD9QKC9_ACRCE|nr:hypothetical protein P5673_013891 [Acropora cervicornis]